MQAILIDEGLPWQVAVAFRTLGLAACAVGDDGAPGRGSTDEENVKWCAAHGAVLVTNDQGRKDKTILDHLASHHVHAVFVLKDLRSAEAHHLARAILQAEQRLDELAGRPRGLIRHRLRATGRLEPV